MEERDTPTQILLSARNWGYCVLSHLRMWLDLHFELNSEDKNEFVFCAKGNQTRRNQDLRSVPPSESYEV